jgi:cytochrome b6-f complex iron-sulfur subunit
MKRRGFLKLLTSVLGLSALGAFAYPLFRFLLPIESGITARKITIAKRDIPLNLTKDLMIGPTPVIIINSKERGFIAFSKICTHLGCLVKYHKDRMLFICPCHAGIFDLEGNVVSGPPPSPLQKFAVKVDGDNIVIG